MSKAQIQVIPINGLKSLYFYRSTYTQYSLQGLGLELNAENN